MPRHTHHSMFTLAVDPGVRNLGMALVMNNPCTVIDVSLTDIFKPPTASNNMSKTQDWCPKTLKAAIDRMLQLVPKGTPVTCLIERQTFGRSIGSIGVHEVVGACMMHLHNLNIRRVHANERVAYFFNKKLKTLSYKKRKAASGAYAKQWVTVNAVPDDVRQMFSCGSKTDDVADAMLMALAHVQGRKLPATDVDTVLSGASTSKKAQKRTVSDTGGASTSKTAQKTAATAKDKGPAAKDKGPAAKDKGPAAKGERATPANDEVIVIDSDDSS
jgi:hypothetical protein